MGMLELGIGHGMNDGPPSDAVAVASPGRPQLGARWLQAIAEVVSAEERDRRQREEAQRVAEAAWAAKTIALVPSVVEEALRTSTPCARGLGDFRPGDVALPPGPYGGEVVLEAEALRGGALKLFEFCQRNDLLLGAEVYLRAGSRPALAIVLRPKRPS